MIKQHKEDYRSEIIVVEDILCNKCGGSCAISVGDYLDNKFQKHKHYYGGLIEKEVTGCYSSTVLEDLTSYKFSLCEKCLMEMLSREYSGYLTR